MSTPSRRLEQPSTGALRISSLGPSESSPSKQIRHIALPDLSVFVSKKNTPYEWSQDLRLVIKGLVYNWILQMKAAVQVYTKHGKGESHACIQMNEGIRTLWVLWCNFRDAKTIDGSILVKSPLFYDFWPEIHRLIKPRNVGGKAARTKMAEIRQNCNYIREGFAQLTRIAVEALVVMEEGADTEFDKLENEGEDVLFPAIPQSFKEGVELPERIVKDLEYESAEKGDFGRGRKGPLIERFRMMTSLPDHPQYDPITKGHPAIQRFKALRYPINQCLAHLDYPFMSTLFLHEGRPTIYVIVDTDLSSIYICKERLEKIIRHLEEEHTFDLAVMQGSIEFSYVDQGSHQKYHELVPNGASIGIESLPNVAFSTGFYLRKKNDPSGDVYAITAGHNVAKFDPVVDKNFPIEEMNESVAPGTRLFQPAFVDYNKTLQIWHAEFDRCKKNLRTLLSQGKLNEAMLEEEEAKQLQQNIEYYEVSIGEESKRVFGTLTEIFELGLSEDSSDQLYPEQNYLYDYAIIKVEPTRVGINGVSKRSRGTQAVKNVRKLKAVMTERAAKMGRTTGYTEGEVGAVEADVGGCKRFPGTTFAFQNIISIAKSFVLKGDSGAGVALEDGGDALGIVQGTGRSAKALRSDPHGHDVTFVLDIERVLKRIAMKFGVDFEVILTD